METHSPLMTAPSSVPAAEAPSPYLKLSHAPRELAALVGKPSVITYHQLYLAVLSGRVPGEMVNGRWMLLRSNLPAIAVTLGLATVPQPAPAQAA